MCRQKMSILFNEIFIKKCCPNTYIILYIYIYNLCFFGTFVIMAYHIL